jgi:cytochrome b
MPMADDTRANRALHIQVWDAPTRLFHWAIVILVFVSWLSADRGLMTVHLCSGLALLALLLFRIGWGIVGSTTARFSDFLRPPRAVIGYLKGLARGEKHLYAGHNPAGGLMVIGIIAILLVQAATGLFANDGLHFSGPLALLISDDASTWITQLHGVIFNLILLLVWCHVVAVGFYLFVKGDNLVKAMVTGKKPHTHVPAELRVAFTRSYIALLLLLLVLTVGGVAWFMIQGGALL